MTYDKVKKVGCSICEKIKDEVESDRCLELNYALSCVLNGELWSRARKKCLNSICYDERDYLMSVLPEPEIERYDDLDTMLCSLFTY